VSKSIITRLIGTFAAVALSLGIGIGAGAPAAAAGTVWDRVARCESGGNWKINTGNGYYGGLQFSRSTWNGFGGRKYASTANRATKSQQIAIARRVLAVQGPGAWPVCSRRAGLTKSNGGASRSATASSNTVRLTAQKVSFVAVSGKKKVRVRSGDTLSRLAHRHDVKGGWRGLWKLNRKTVSNPNAIYVGQLLRIRK
jgi:nucleoid-associated protein YgaU